jgi:hypothetical protein
MESYDFTYTNHGRSNKTSYRYTDKISYTYSNCSIEVTYGFSYAS